MMSKILMLSIALTVKLIIDYTIANTRDEKISDRKSNLLLCKLVAQFSANIQNIYLKQASIKFHNI